MLIVNALAEISEGICFCRLIRFNYRTTSGLWSIVNHQSSIANCQRAHYRLPQKKLLFPPKNRLPGRSQKTSSFERRCKVTTPPLRVSNVWTIIFQKNDFFRRGQNMRSFWSFGHLVKIVSWLSKSATIIINIYL